MSTAAWEASLAADSRLAAPLAGADPTALLRTAADTAAAFLGGVHSRPVRPDADRPMLHAALGGALPEDPGDPLEVLDRLVAAVEPALLLSQSPRFFGFVMGGSHPVALAADWLTSAWDQNAAIYASSPAAAVAERVVGRWLLDLLELPGDSSVGFVTGGQMATWTCLAAARHQVLADVGWDVERDGLHGAPQVHVLVGAQRHGTVDRALRFLGLGSDRAMEVAADEQGRMCPDALAASLDQRQGATIVVAEAGNVSTGAFDPMGKIAATAHQHGAWLHVDGAFGLWARASSRRRHLTEGLEQADSWSVDAHKWLNVPYDSGLAITRHPDAHRAALGQTAAYLVCDEDSRHDQINWNPEHSRRARGFAIWATLRTLGRRGVEDLVDRLCDRALQFAEGLSGVDGVELLNDVVLNQVLVRFTNAEDPDEHTRNVIARVQRDGTCWMSGTTWRGRTAMRISVCNWATSQEDVERSVDAILRGAGLDLQHETAAAARRLC